MQRLCTLVPATLLLTAILSPTLALCGWIALVLCGNVLYVLKLALIAKRLIIASAAAGPLMFIANASVVVSVSIAVVLVVTSRWSLSRTSAQTPNASRVMSDSSAAV